jgi:hypothetical protein
MLKNFVSVGRISLLDRILNKIADRIAKRLEERLNQPAGVCQAVGKINPQGIKVFQPNDLAISKQKEAKLKEEANFLHD